MIPRGGAEVAENKSIGYRPLPTRLLCVQNFFYDRASVFDNSGAYEGGVMQAVH